MTVRNLAIDSTTGDLFLVAGNLALVSDVAAVIQAVNTNLRTFLGEWFLDDPNDPKLGVPYYQKVLIKNPDPSILRTVFRSIIVGTVGVADANLTDLSYVGNQGSNLRSLNIAWRGTSDTGQFISGNTSLTTP